jgi:diguanylate cyclase (GGDEF)-like protein
MVAMENGKNNPTRNTEPTTLIERITPLARQINCLDMGRIADLCVQYIPTLVNVRLVSIYVLDDNNYILHLLQHNHSYAINRIVSLSQTPVPLMSLAVRSKELVLIEDLDTHQKPIIRRSQRLYADKYQTRGCAIVPLICQDRVVGVLNLADKIGGPFDTEDIALIELFGQLVGASIGNIKLFEEMERQATTDGLTGLVNHRTFYDLLEKELIRSRRYGGHISLIMVDIDNLKRINDTYGHRAGDKVIQDIGSRITHCVRQIDVAARYGGDEFAVILPNTCIDDAVIAANRMVEVVSRSPALWEKEAIELSISVGVGEYDAHTNPDDMTSRSDKALYSAKQSGKNTVRIYGKS